MKNGMDWVSEQPKETGYYWYRKNKNDHIPFIVQVVWLNFKYCNLTTEFNECDGTGEWYGPILPPDF